LVHAYYCKFKPGKSAFHDFLDNIRGNRLTMTFLSVTGFYVLFFILLAIFFTTSAIMYKVSYSFMFIFLSYVVTIATYPFAYYIFRVNIFEPVHQISVKWLVQQQIIAKPDEHTVNHEDILHIVTKKQ
jgi:cellulose synthase/poly-beta-1,6-N-acetylglucosamine synthase-like glycosyltransferase